MTNSYCKTLIENTFESSFDRENFLIFIKNLLNEIDESKAFHARGYVKEKFKGTTGIIKTYERLGTYTDPEGKKIDILVVYLEKDNSLSGARTTLRNFVADYLKQRAEKDAGLVAFVPPGKKDWRFSFVKMEYELAKDSKGKLKGIERYTPARRYSFLVGEGESSHTAKSCLLPILHGDERNPPLKRIEEAFSIERVTKEFFEKYRILFIKVKDHLEELIKKDEELYKDFQDKKITAVDFTKKLLGQIVFLYFLQKKGWFGVNRKENWGTGSKSFLRDLFNKKYYTNFFNEILEPLFYEALRNDRSYDHHYYSRFDCRIPFLNGGLFDPINDYNWVETEILLPNELFSNEKKTKEGDLGNGVFDIFDRFNFTVKEDEPLEKEVAIDPEMLGRIFEKLGAITPDKYDEWAKAVKSGDKKKENKANKKLGVYYTPREIVHYMCQESLINYLFNNFAEETQKEDFKKLVFLGERILEHDTRVEQFGKETLCYSYQIPSSIRKNAKKIDDCLANIRICDPAVGSGAFPVGMMSEIVRTRNILSSYIKNNDKRTSYRFKRDAIQNCLYGVDVDPGAVEIAKLRLWLSLIVDEEDINQIKPLPNLDYKIVKGNSLLGYPYLPHWGSEIESLKKEYFEETNPFNKHEIKNRIDTRITEFLSNSEKSLGYKVDFDFKIFFSEIFKEKNGFDVVIENPPYVRVDEINKTEKKDYKSFFKTAMGKYDLYYLFFEKSLEIAHENGCCVFISPNKFCAADSAKSLRKVIFETINSGEIISTSKLKIFEDVSNYPIISVLNKKADDHPHFLVRQVKDQKSLSNKGAGEHYTANSSEFDLFPYQVIPINIGQFDFDLVKNLYRKREKLSSKLSVSEGLRIPTKFESDNPQDLRIVKQYQFSKYSEIEVGQYISIKKLKKVLSSNADRYKKIFKPKILIAEDALEITGTLDVNNYVPQGGVYFGTITSNDINIKFLLGLINSKLLSYVYEVLYAGMHMGGGYLRYRTKFLESMPIPRIETSESEMISQIIKLVEKIEAIAKKDKKLNWYEKIQEFLKQINQIVYELYGLRKEEIEFVENKIV